MKVIHIKERGGDEVYDYKKAIKSAKRGADMVLEAMQTICDLTEEMEDEYGYGERREDPYRMGNRSVYGERRYSGHGYSGREWDDLDERRGSYYR